jgi:hypothetical protein
MLSALRRRRFSLTLKAMDVHFSPEIERKLRELAAQAGRRSADELVQDVVEDTSTSLRGPAKCSTAVMTT